jgi:hypothetical protein
MSLKSQPVENKGTIENSAAAQNVDGRPVQVIGRNADGTLLQRGFANASIAAQWASMQVSSTVERVQ